METLRYPIGRFERPESPSPDDVRGWIEEIAALPQQLHEVVEHLTDEQLDTRYRPGGWTRRQVVHHIGDSHLNGFVRMKWALTEDRPLIKAYDEVGWAELPDYRDVPVETSLIFIEGLHERWVALMQALDEEALAREFVHPEGGPVTLAQHIANYAWHGRHHLGHLTL